MKIYRDPTGRVAHIGEWDGRGERPSDWIEGDEEVVETDHGRFVAGEEEEGVRRVRGAAGLTEQVAGLLARLEALEKRSG